MGKTKFTTARTFLNNLKEEKGIVLSFDDLKVEITKKIGADEDRTIKPYIKLMLDLNLISPEGENVRLN